MLTPALLCGGLALVCWPAPRATSRLAAMFEGRNRTVGLPKLSRRVALPGAAGLVIVVALTLGAVPTVALILLGTAAGLYRRSRARTRSEIAEIVALVEALRTMVGELKAGAHPAVAAEAAAADAGPAAASTLRAAAASVRLGGDLTPAVPPDGDEALVRLTRAWSLAREHGLPLARVLEAAQRDLESKVRMVNQLDARMAGARASVAILAVLPVAGIALGEAMGAGPLLVLTTTPVGQLLLVLGSALVLAGVAWSVALTGRVMVR